MPAIEGQTVRRAGGHFWGSITLVYNPERGFTPGTAGILVENGGQPINTTVIAFRVRWFPHHLSKTFNIIRVWAFYRQAPLQLQGQRSSKSVRLVSRSTAHVENPA
jgi:hypothetical protein